MDRVVLLAMSATRLLLDYCGILLSHKLVARLRKTKSYDTKT